VVVVTDHRLSIRISRIVEQQISHIEPVLLGGRVKCREPILHTINYRKINPQPSSSSFNFKAHEKSKSTQIKAGTIRQETALTVALKININTSIKHQTVNKAYNIRKTRQTAKIR